MRRKVFAEGLRRGPAAWGPPERERVTKRTHLKKHKNRQNQDKTRFCLQSEGRLKAVLLICTEPRGFEPERAQRSGGALRVETLTDSCAETGRLAQQGCKIPYTPPKETNKLKQAYLSLFYPTNE